jgi:hypothetical protein
VGTSYTMKLPTTAGSTSQCLRTDTVDATQLVFGSCAAAGGDGGVLSLGGLDGQTANSNGGSIQGTLFYQQSASGTNPGLVNTGTQTFAGNKTFSGTLNVTGAVSIASSLNVTGGATFGSNVTMAGAGLEFSGVATDITTAGNQDLTIAPNGTGNIVLGVSDTTAQLLVLDTKTSSGDPTGIAGGMYYNSNSGKFRCYQNGAWGDCLSSVYRVASNVSNSSSSTYSDVTGLTASVKSGATYAFSCDLTYTAAAGTTALHLSVNGPTTSALDYATQIATSTTAWFQSAQTAYDTVTNPVTSGGTTRLPASISGSFTATADGTFAVRFKSEVNTSAVTIQQGSWCTVLKQ